MKINELSKRLARFCFISTTSGIIEQSYKSTSFQPLSSELEVE